MPFVTYSSKIIQVKAAQMVVSEKYKAGYTLRFPRVVSLRVDKNWYECLDLSGRVESGIHFKIAKLTQT